MAGSERVRIDPHIGVRSYCAGGVADYVARDDASTRISSKREREPDRPEVQFPVSPLRRRAALPPPVHVILSSYYYNALMYFHITVITRVTQPPGASPHL